MIEFLRIDDRLLHGQVVAKWLNFIGPDALVVANDKAANNEISRLALKMASPQGMRFAIKTVSDAIDLINNSKVENLKLFVVVKNSSDARRIVENVKEVNVVNIGGMSYKGEEGKMIVGSVFANAKDIENIKSIIPKVRELDVRVVPSSSKKDFFSCI